MIRKITRPIKLGVIYLTNMESFQPNRRSGEMPELVYTVTISGRRAKLTRERYVTGNQLREWCMKAMGETDKYHDVPLSQRVKGYWLARQNRPNGITFDFGHKADLAECSDFVLNYIPQDDTQQNVLRQVNLSRVS